MSTPGTLMHRVDYRRLATRQARVNGRIELSGMPRVMAEMAGTGARDNAVVVDLGFTEDAQRRVRVEGSLDATLELLCQRCLQVFDAPLHVDVAGVVVADDAAAADVPREDEPMLADGDRLDMHALVADELLLAMPNVARCSAPDCTARFATRDAPQRQTSDEKPTNPFAVLGQLNSKDRDADD